MKLLGALLLVLLNGNLSRKTNRNFSCRLAAAAAATTTRLPFAYLNTGVRKGRSRGILFKWKTPPSACLLLVLVRVIPATATISQSRVQSMVLDWLRDVGRVERLSTREQGDVGEEPHIIKRTSFFIPLQAVLSFQDTPRRLVVSA